MCLCMHGCERETEGSRGSHWRLCVSAELPGRVTIMRVCFSVPVGRASVAVSGMRLQVLSKSLRVLWFLTVWICAVCSVYVQIYTLGMVVCVCITGTTYSASPAFSFSQVGMELWKAWHSQHARFDNHYQKRRCQNPSKVVSYG